MTGTASATARKSTKSGTGVKPAAQRLERSDLCQRLASVDKRNLAEPTLQAGYVRDGDGSVVNEAYARWFTAMDKAQIVLEAALGDQGKQLALELEDACLARIAEVEDAMKKP